MGCVVAVAAEFGDCGARPRSDDRLVLNGIVWKLRTGSAWRDGLSTKVHLACDGLGRPLGFVLSGGNANHCTRLEKVVDSISVPGVGPGRPRTRPDHVVADKGYSSRKIRAYLRRRGIPHTIPERAGQILGRLNRSTHDGRPPRFDR